MHIKLPERMEQIINEQVESGLYSSASEVMREAIRTWLRQNEQQVQLERLRREIAIGLEQLDRGEGIVFDKAEAENVKKRGRERLKKLKK